MRVLRQFLLAVSFLTRIPVRRLDLAAADLPRAVVYFPLVGMGIGGLGAAVFWATHMWFSISISIAVTLGFLMLLTGGLHEDGLADTFDAFGSQHKKDKILEVMRDSRIGTYGTLAVVTVVLLKVLCLAEMSSGTVMRSLLLAHLVSRWATLIPVVLLPYPRNSASWSKRFVESVSTMPRRYLVIATVYTCVLTVLLAGLDGAWFIGCAGLVSGLASWYFWRKIRGATGDCFGTVQQCTELIT